MVITNGAQSNAIINANQKAVTISQLYPDGSGTMNRDRYVTASFIANKDTKFEYLYMQKEPQGTCMNDTLFTEAEAHGI